MIAQSHCEIFKISNLVHLHGQGDTVRFSDGTYGVIEDLGWVSFFDVS
jgi:hypothetical protein